MMFEDIQSLLRSEKDEHIASRRDVLKMGMAGILASAVPIIGAGKAEARTLSNVGHLAFKHAHTGEGFDGVYRVGNKYLPEAFERINFVLRDFRTGEIFPMDPHVLDTLSAIQARLPRSKHIDIYSAYRSPRTNAKLRRASRGVARNSFHMYGQALDIHVDGYSTQQLRNIAVSLRAGGVGYYPRSKFIHIDTGDVRSW